MHLEQLNQQFAIPDQVDFIEGPGGLIQARIRNQQADALISTYAGQVLGYRPGGQEQDLLFVSGAAYYEAGRAIKGGIPICWPWFGPDPEGKGRGGHGFVRNRQWQVVTVEALANGAHRLVLGLESDADTRAVWPMEFSLRLEITVAQTLALKLITRNRDTRPMQITQGLHTYFRVGDISRAAVHGLEGTAYIDKVDGERRKVQSGTVQIATEVDRIYLDTEAALVVSDAGLGRQVRIHSTGSHSAVVWNPWSALSRSMADLADDDYEKLLCVETTNAGPDVVNIAPGESYQLAVDYAVAPR